jgi:hypothetical protein
MRRRPLVLAALGACLSLAGCGDPICPLGIEPAIIIRPVTSSGNPVELDGKGEVVNRAYRDSLVAFEVTVEGKPRSFAGGWGRPGIYDVRLEVPGFAPWQRHHVRARAADCGVIPTQLEAILTVAP